MTYIILRSITWSGEVLLVSRWPDEVPEPEAIVGMIDVVER